MKTNYIKILFIFLIILASYACKDNELTVLDTSNTSEGYFVRDGYLVFESKESFRNSINTILNLSEKDRKSWEEKIGFVSQQRIASNVIREELKKDSINRIKFANTDLCPTKNTDYNSEAYIKALSSVKKSDLHSDAYYNALKDGVIKLIDENTENEYWDFTVFSSVYTAFINKEGLYAIGDTLYQVTNNSVKTIKYTDPKSKNELLNSKENNNILYKSPIQKATSPGVLTSGWVQEPTGPWYPKRIKIDVELSLQYLIVSTLHYEFFHRVHMECQGRNFFRKWIDKNLTATIEL